MTDNTISAAASKPQLKTISLEMISTDLDVVLTFVEAAARFNDNLYRLAVSPGATAQCFKPDAEHAANMVGAIRDRITDAKEQLDAFIAEAPAGNVRVERSAA